MPSTHYTVLKQAKTEAIKAAKDFHYPQDIIMEIENSDSINRISCLMAKARHDKFDKE